jgi:short subunit dehydrogenase-like uncharacterized protein
LDSVDGRSLERGVKRIIVLGGLGQFGRTAAEQLRALGMSIHIAVRQSSSHAPRAVQAATAHGVCLLHSVDANDSASIRAAFHAGDIVIDIAGPFHARSTALIEAATQIGFDIIDINDDLRYAQAILVLEPRIESAGIRVLSSASTVSAVAAAVVRHSGVAAPKRVTAFLAPASRHTASAGAALSLIRSLGRPVRVFRDGHLQERQGWSEARRFRMPPPVETVCGRLFESADAVYLPRIWQSLQDVAMYVDTKTPGVNTLLRLAARWPAVRTMLERQVRWSTSIARTFGSSAGGIGYEIEDTGGQVIRYAIVSDKHSFIAAVAPAVLAAKAIAEDRFAARGLVLPDRHVEPEELFAFLDQRGIALL